MGSFVSSLAFPAPIEPRKFYEEEVLSRKDFVKLQTSLKEYVPAVFVVSKRPTNDKVIIYSHGNAEDLGLHMDYIEELADATGCSVLTYEYVGYSLSRIDDGKSPSESGCYRSVECAWAYLVNEKNIEPTNIIIFGRSIGSGPSVHLAASKSNGGLFLQSPIASGAKVLFGLNAWIPKMAKRLDIFKNYEKIASVTSKVAITHGNADEVVPVENGQYLLSRVPEKLRFDDGLWLKGFGHNNMPEDRIFEYVNKFVKG